MSLPLSNIVDLVKQRLKVIDVDVANNANIDTIVDLYRQRVSTINELAESILYCFKEFDEYDAKAAKKGLVVDALEPLKYLSEGFELLTDWRAESIHQVIQAVTERLNVGMGKVGQPLRVAVTGGSFSPPIDQTVEVIGKAQTLKRILRAIDYVSKL
jgi:glutamyl-tRNA synthetase